MIRILASDWARQHWLIQVKGLCSNCHHLLDQDQALVEEDQHLQHTEKRIETRKKRKVQVSPDEMTR